MLKNKTIFILSLMKFDGLPSTNFTIAEHLSKDNKVYYIDHPFTIKDCWNDRKTTSYKLRKPHFSPLSSGIHEINRNLKVVIIPPVLPINWLPKGKFYDYTLKINEKIILSRINKILKQEKIKNYIFINFFDFHYPGIASKLVADLNIYYCVDPIIIPYDKKHGLDSEYKIVTTSDVIICTSKALYKEKILQNRNTHFIPNAADLTHTGKALDVDLKNHFLLKDVPKPIVGYIGNIERRLDFKLLEYIIQEHPDKSFVLAGPIAEEYIPKKFKEFKNLHLVGPINYSEIPAMLKGFDLCIIPFKKDEVSNTIFPLKLFEYLGAGKPVIASDFNLDLQDFTLNSVKYCENEQVFSDAINVELKTDKLELIDRRIAVAKENTWQKRLVSLGEIIQIYINNK